MMNKMDKKTIKAKILLVDDELYTLRRHIEALESARYKVITATNYAEAMYEYGEHRPEVVILDSEIGDNERKGLDILKKIRQTGQNTYIIMLTKLSDEELAEISIIRGVDYFVRKAEPPAYLVAVVRRALHHDRLEYQEFDEYIRIDRRNNTVSINKDGKWQEVHLQPKEYEILDKLISESPRVVTREALEREFFPNSENPTGALNRFIATLRKKIEPDPHNPQYIMLRAGIGYYFRSNKRN
jgi:DNA-binding response OmpR family regulator